MASISACLLVLIAASTACAEGAKQRNDVTWVCPLVTKGRLYWQDGTPIRKDIPQYPEPQAIYVRSDGSAIELSDPRNLATAVRVELGERDLTEAEYARLILPFYFFGCLQNRGQFFDQDYVATRAKEGDKEAQAVAAFKAICAMPACKFNGNRWDAVFYVIREDYMASVIERDILIGDRRPFSISEVRREFIETHIGIAPLVR